MCISSVDLFGSGVPCPRLEVDPGDAIVVDPGLRPGRGSPPSRDFTDAARSLIRTSEKGGHDETPFHSPLVHSIGGRLSARLSPPWSPSVRGGDTGRPS